MGMMGAGKSEVGRALADQLGYDFIDTDALVEKQSGQSIAAIFAEKGEEEFRRIESEVITTLSGRQSAVVSAGGGAPAFSANLTILSSLGTTVYLKASAQELYQRIKNDRKRPLMQVENPRAQMASLLRTREPFYRNADVVMDTEMLSVDEVVDKLIDELAKRTIETQME
jgi:shikimate kinase